MGMFKTYQVAGGFLHKALDHCTELLTIAAKILSPKYELYIGDIFNVTIIIHGRCGSVVEYCSCTIECCQFESGTIPFFFLKTTSLSSKKYS
jgi:hypothetical protein